MIGLPTRSWSRKVTIYSTLPRRVWGPNSNTLMIWFWISSNFQDTGGHCEGDPKLLHSVDSTDHGK